MQETINKQFGIKIKAERIRQGFTQEQLADKAGVHRTYVGMIERAEKNITLSNMYKLSTALSTPLYKLLIFSNNNT